MLEMKSISSNTWTSSNSEVNKVFCNLYYINSIIAIVEDFFFLLMVLLVSHVVPSYKENRYKNNWWRMVSSFALY